MAWLEIIEIRAASNSRKELESQLQDLINEVNQNTDVKTIKIYRDVVLKADISIHLVHESEKTDRTCSPTCNQLVSSLRDFGLLNHRIWIEMPRCESAGSVDSETRPGNKQ